MKNEEIMIMLVLYPHHSPHILLHFDFSHMKNDELKQMRRYENKCDTQYVTIHIWT